VGKLQSMKSQPELPTGWDTSKIPDQSGKRFLITGGNSGLGLESAKALVAKGAHVTITARSEVKGVAAMATTGAQEFLELDLADLSSVRSAAAKITEPFNVVLLNAGIMVPPFAKTVDGFESQLGTNFLGHFAFAGLIEKFVTDRWVVTTSFVHRFGNFGDQTKETIRNRCRGIGHYSPWISYGDSKLADLIFVNELERRRVSRSFGAIPLAAHPGWSHTNLTKRVSKSDLASRVNELVAGKIAQSAAEGALPLLCAATLPGITHTAFFGPDKFFELKGSPKFTHGKALAYDQRLATNLWQVAEELTGVAWENSPHA
jgi:NAD(P)-dependent dehydrogenase (short-subunit alcohol dehydrogenase family)